MDSWFLSWLGMVGRYSKICEAASHLAERSRDSEPRVSAAALRHLRCRALWCPLFLWRYRSGFNIQVDILWKMMIVQLMIFANHISRYQISHFSIYIFMLIMLGLPWWMLGDEFIDIPSLGWVETNPSDDNYDYYHKTHNYRFFLWWCHQAPGLGFSALRRRLRTGGQSRVDGAGAPELPGQEGHRCSKWRCLKMGPQNG